MYKIISSAAVMRTVDGAMIPADPKNTDYAEYLAWVAAGNEPAPADPRPTPSYADLRRAEYPPMEDLIDGLVKNDQEQIEAYRSACLAVKAKYPKP